MQQDIRRGMHEEPELVCGETVAGTPVGGQVNFHLFYVQLHGAPAAVRGLVYEARIGVFQVRDDEAHVGTAVVHLYLHDHPFGMFPAAGPIGELAEEAHFLPIFTVSLQRLVQPGLHPLVENLVARQAEHELHVLLSHDPVHKLFRAEMGVAAHDEAGLLPVAPHHPYQPAQDAVDVGRLVTAAGTQHGKDHFTRDAFEDEQGHVAFLAIIIVEKRSLLLPVSVEGSVVAVKDDTFGFFVIGGYELLHEAYPHLIQLPYGTPVLKPGHGRLGAQGGGIGGLSSAHFQHGVVP